MKPRTDRLRKFAAQLKNWCVDDWEAKIVALVLACIVWFVVRDKIARDKKITLPEGFNMTRSPEAR